MAPLSWLMGDVGPKGQGNFLYGPFSNVYNIRYLHALRVTPPSTSESLL